MKSTVEDQKCDISSEGWKSDQDHQLSQWPSKLSPSSSTSLTEMEAGNWSPSQLAALAPDSAFSEAQQLWKAMTIGMSDQEKFNCINDPAFADLELGGISSSSMSSIGWSTILIGCAGIESPTQKIDHSSAESLGEILYPTQAFPSATPTAGCMMTPEEMHNIWESVVNNELSQENNEHTTNSYSKLYKLPHDHTPLLQFALSQDHNYNSRLLDPGCLPTSHVDSSPRLVSLPAQKMSDSETDDVTLKVDSSSSKIKQDPDDFYYEYRSSGIRTLNPGGTDIAHTLANRTLKESFPASLQLPQLLQYSSKLPATMISQLPNTASCQSNPLERGAGKVLSDSSSTRSDELLLQKLSDVVSFKMLKSQTPTTGRSCNSPQHSVINHDPDIAHPNEGRGLDNDKKRAVTSILAITEPVSAPRLFKRPRLLDPVPTLVPLKVKKEKLGQKITTLQQLVSPFGKTDTASVLFEAIGYIKFLHEQVQVLSRPYMKKISMSSHQNEAGKSSWNSDKKIKVGGEEIKQDLRSRGLCLLPVSCTQKISNDNGADYWAPGIGGSFR